VKRLRSLLTGRRPRHATVVAYLALFVALGGGAYAVSGIPDRGGAFHGCVSKKTGVLRVVPAGAKCHRAKGRVKGELAITWSQQGPRGLQGPGGAAGAAGQAFDAGARLPSGQTLTGVWAVSGTNGDVMATQVQFVPPLSGDLAAGAVQRVVSAPTAQCPGVGSAARGFFCLYEKASSATFNGIFDAASQNPGANRTGAVIDYTGSASSTGANGTWAVTAP
jgi:hypothetical protein